MKYTLLTGNNNLSITNKMIDGAISGRRLKPSLVKAPSVPRKFPRISSPTASRVKKNQLSSRNYRNFQLYRKPLVKNSFPEIKNDRTLSPGGAFTSRKFLTVNKISVSTKNTVRGFASKTHRGLLKPTNEDRITIALELEKPPYREHEVWPKCSLFAIFDGHRGPECSQFLKDNFNNFLVNDFSFPTNPRLSLKNAFQEAETKFLTTACESENYSGSCALVLLFIGKFCYCANLGDSRAIACSGSRIVPFSKDHKPSNPEEKERIEKAGGKIYRNDFMQNGKVRLGCFRVNPGGLAISRSLGDMKAKFPKYGGNSQVVISNPDITVFQVQHFDFIVMGSDGLFDKLSNEEIVRSVFDAAKANEVGFQLVAATEELLKKAFEHKSMDNISTVIIALSDLIQ